jgi:D-alanine-D-alanine ligase
MKVLVLGGGTSNEREVSLRSAAAVQKALESLGHEVAFYDPADGYDGLKQFQGNVDVVFPILHGAGGEDGEIQQVLDDLDMTYVGSGVNASKLAFHKEQTKKQLQELGIVVPGGELVSARSYKDSKHRHKPYVLKPVKGGSSLDTFVVHDLVANGEHDKTLAKYETMLIEELIDGVEITVPVLGNKALPVI